MKPAFFLFISCLLTGFTSSASASAADKDQCIRGEPDRAFLKNSKLIFPQTGEDAQFLAKEETTLRDGTKLTLLHLGCETYGIQLRYTLKKQPSLTPRQAYGMANTQLTQTFPLLDTPIDADIRAMKDKTAQLAALKTNDAQLGSEIELSNDSRPPVFTVNTEDQPENTILTMSLYVPL